MVVLVGEVSEGLLAELGRSANVSVARAPEAGQQDGAQPRPGWQAGALAMREAAGRQSAYVIVPDDPLAEVAAAWREMWDVASGPGAAVTSRSTPLKRWPHGGTSDSNYPTTTWWWLPRRPKAWARTCISVRCGPAGPRFPSARTRNLSFPGA